MDIGRRIREVREELGMPGTVLARRAGVSKNHLYMIEHGDRTPSVALLENIARELRVEPADLLREPVPLAGPPAGGQRSPDEPLMPRPKVQEWLSGHGHETQDEFLSLAEDLESRQEVEQAIRELRERRDGLVDKLGDRSVQVELFGPVRPRDFEEKKAREREALRPAKLAGKLKQEIRHEYGAREDALADYSSILFVEGKADDYLVREPVGERDRERHERLLEARRVFERTYADLSAAV